MLVERTVSQWRGDKWVSEGEKLSDFRSADAYVLLGEAGSGKSTAFEVEATRASVEPVTARRFIRRSLDAHPEWREGTLFIDGLDEVRARAGDPREPLDTVICRLEELGNPRFRLSCREDSWLGQNDLRELSSVMGHEEPQLLRLDPLSEEDAERILAAAGVADTDLFLWRAKDRGLAAFLQNPLLLDLLVRGQGNGDWPDGRLATFERGCETLARETNREHLDARDGDPFAIEEVVLAAGRLCALLLLCDNSGWSRRGPAHDEYPALSEAGEGQALLKFALDTKLFEGSAETGRRPRHRQIAEFLAAKYLDHLIRDRALPATRVLAWMKGIDGIVMPDLRGVSAWLAARNRDIRSPLIESDPVGVAFLGDAEGFSREEIALVLDRVEARLTRRGNGWSSASLGALMAGPGRESLFDMLRAPDRSRVRHDLVERLLRGLGEATMREGRSGAQDSVDSRRAVYRVLDATVRDSTWRCSVRNRALIELIWVLEDMPEGPSILVGLLSDLAEGEVTEDERGSLGPRLLAHLYPQHLRADQLWDCIERLWSRPPPPNQDQSIQKSRWARQVARTSTSEDVRTLLDTLIPKARTLHGILARHGVEGVAKKLLIRGLRLFGEKLDLVQLYKWFELVQVEPDRPGLVPAHCEGLAERSRGSTRIEDSAIYGWLRGHQDTQLALILEGLKRNAVLPRERALDHAVGVKFLGDRAPYGFRRWCLKRAVALAETDPASAVELAFWTVTEREAWGRPLDSGEILTAVRATPHLLEWYGNRVAEEKRSVERAAELRSSPRYVQVRERKQAYLASIREHLPAIEAGQGPPELLHELGRIYLSGFGDAGTVKQARSELALHLGDQHDLRDGVIRGFRNLVGRTDLPDLDVIVRLYENGRMSPFGAPFLVGLTGEEYADRKPLQQFDEATLRRALGFYLLSRLHSRSHPVPVSFVYPDRFRVRRSKYPRPYWYHRALETHPQIVADAFVAVHRARVRAKELPDQHLYDFAFDEEYRSVAPLAISRMFTPFPSRCTETQVVSLRLVLWAALKYMLPDDLRQLILRRVRRKDMDPAQYGTWLGAGLFAGREACLPRILVFLSEGMEERFRDLLEFLVPYRDPLPNQEWPTADLVTLVKAVGAKLSSPWDAGGRRRASSDQPSFGDGFDLGMKVDALIRVWVETLADRVDAEAVAGLSALAEGPSLKDWRGMLLSARDKQAERHRVSAYTTPTLPEIRNALRGGPPTGPADLAALVTDKLAHLAGRIRDGNTDPWQQYWHTDPADPKGRNVIKPKSEDPCRDALLSDLQLLLEPHGVDAQPEGHYAEDARSDIIAVHGSHAVVVEIKKTDSRDLWRAMNDQLIARYTRDPRTGGYGIYLVLWFGADHLRRSPPTGTRPRSPEEIRRMLEGLLTHEQSRTITVIVVDVSAPVGRVVLSEVITTT